MVPGDVLAERFEIESTAGAGGMGTVFRARDLTTGEPVALKVLHAALAPEASRFVREAQVLASLEHPAIVRYIAHGETPSGAPWIALEWLDGRDLAATLAGGGLSPPAAVGLVRRVAEALAIAHARGILHRDIKPSNLFLRDGDPARVVVLDFGIARRLNAAGDTRTGAPIGTPAYMAPEQARGVADVDHRVDVFALGCVLFECLAGRAAFPGTEVMAVLARILLEDAPRLASVRPELPAELDALCASMLAKDPSQRPADMASVARALAALGDVDGAPPPPALPASPALTAGEQRLLSVIMAGGAPLAAPVVPDAPTAVPRDEASHDALARVARAHGGRLEPLLDGAFVVVLAEGGAATDQAARAARCALALRAAAPDLPIAVATGRGVVAGALPVGAVVDRAVRVLRAGLGAMAVASAAGARPVAVDEVTVGLLDPRYIVAHERGALLLRGEREVVDAARTVHGVETPCVGRDRELAMLEGALAGCEADGAARVVLVTAPAGAGKTRLRYELLRRLARREQRVSVLHARGDALSAGSPFGMLRPALRAAAGVRAGEDAELQARRFRARVGRHVAERDVPRVAAFLGELAGVRAPGEGDLQLRAARRDPTLMGDQMRRAWEDFLAAECAAQPVLLVLEDLHWGDLPTVRFVDAALRNLSDSPLLVLALARPEVHELFPDLWTARDCTEVRLPPLPRKAGEALARAVLGSAVDTARIAAMVDRAGGHALYLEELLRAEAEGQGGEQAPETVLVMVQSRLARLPAEARRALRAASVFGQAFWPGGVQALLGGEESGPALEGWLSLLEVREVIAARGEGRFPGELEYAFRHALAREAAYETLTPHDRALGHRLAGTWLVARGEPDALVLAEHFERGGEPAQAAAWYRRAAEHALEGNDHAAAVARVQRGLAGDAPDETQGALHLLGAEAHRWRGEFAEARAAAERALALLPRGSDAWCRAVAEAVFASGLLADGERLLSLAAALREEAPGEPDARTAMPPARVIAAAHVVVQLNHLGRYALAQDLLDWLRERAGDTAAHDPLVAAWIDRAQTMRAASDVEPATLLAAAGSSAADFARAGDVRMACFQRMNLGYARASVGLFAEAIEAAEEALADAERMGLTHVAASCRSYLGFALARAGQVERGVAVLREGVEALQSLRETRQLGRARGYLARVLLAAGALDEAALEAEAAVAACASIPTARALARIIVALVAVARGRYAEARDAVGDALSTLAERGSVEDGECLLRLAQAEALQGLGDAAGARESVAAARAWLDARSVRIADERVRRAFRTAVPEHARVYALCEAWGL